MSAYERVTFRGATVDRMTRQGLRKAERRLGYKLTITQGSYNAGAVRASAGTHDGGGVVDLSAYDWRRKVRVLNELGFCAFYRPDRPGVWSAHIHVVMKGHRGLAPVAARQVEAYDNKRDGLAGNGPYFGPWVENRPFVYNAKSRGAGVERARQLLKNALERSGDFVITRRRPLKRALEILSGMEKVYAE